MSFAILVTAALIGPQAAPDANYWRDEYRALLAATTERANARPEVVVPRMVSLYVQLKDLDLPAYERARMRRSLEGRLVKQLEVLVREKRKQDRAAKRGSLAGGSATDVGAMQLINVIVTTIAPDSWRQNGGNGSITYYPINPALVVRQTSEVHEQVSALVQALAK